MANQLFIYVLRFIVSVGSSQETPQTQILCLSQQPFENDGLPYDSRYSRGSGNNVEDDAKGVCCYTNDS